jgi:hypothetical protein
VSRARAQIARGGTPHRLGGRRAYQVATPHLQRPHTLVRSAHRVGRTVGGSLTRLDEGALALLHDVELGCDLVQGNFIARACPADELVLTPR